MTRAEFLSVLDELLEQKPGTIQGGENLADIWSWDSVAVVGFIAMVDERLGLRVTGKSVLDCKTVDDLIALAGDKIVA